MPRPRHRRSFGLQGNLLGRSFTAVLVLLTAAAIYTSILVGRQQNEPSETSRYNVTWLVSQAGVELSRLQTAVAATALPGSPVEAADVQLRFDILLNRAKTLEVGDAQEFFRSDPELAAIVQQFAATLDRAQPLVDGLDQGGSPSELFDLLSPLVPRLSRLASAANIRSGDMVGDFQNRLVFLYRLFRVVLAGMVASGVVLMVSLRRQNGTLQRAQAAAESMAADLRQTGGWLDAALNNMANGLCLFDPDGGLVLHNKCFAAMFGRPVAASSAVALGREFGAEAMFASPGAGRTERDDRRMHDLADGRVIQVSRQAIPGQGWVATFEDVTERRRSQERLSHLARHDALTGLPNRVVFREHTEAALSDGAPRGAFAVLCLDLDGFKLVNDTLGHPAGDELLRQVARRLRDCVADADLVARLGGDEFAIVQMIGTWPDDTVALADRLVVSLSIPFDLNGQPAQIGTSIGLAMADQETTPDNLLRNADIALYRAKAEGRGTWRLFEAGMDAEVQRRHALETDLRQALAQEEFELHYQPLVKGSAEALTGFEALLRWRHPTRGLVSPADFIAMAEETGLIKAMGHWVLNRACADAATWPEHLKIAVNLSAKQFVSESLVREVERALALSGLRPGRLELEITETVFLQDSEATLNTLRRLKQLGVRISMDDFGTGYSSLSYLRSFPFDKIKIDQSFVRDLLGASGAVEIVRAVVALGKALGMEVLAEGVETTQQRDILLSEGCCELQGYLFSRPLPHTDVSDLIAAFANDAPPRSKAFGAIGADGACQKGVVGAVGFEPTTR